MTGNFPRAAHGGGEKFDGTADVEGICRGVRRRRGAGNAVHIKIIVAAAVHLDEAHLHSISLLFRHGVPGRAFSPHTPGGTGCPAHILISMRTAAQACPATGRAA